MPGSCSPGRCPMGLGGCVFFNDTAPAEIYTAKIVFVLVGLPALDVIASNHKTSLIYVLRVDVLAF